MTKKFNKREGKSRARRERMDFLSVNDELSSEKKKARDLRHTPWWRKKIASGTCYYCGKKVHPAELTMDHKIPLSRGGKSERINIVAACKECNNRKKYLLPAEWDEYIRMINPQNSEKR